MLNARNETLLNEMKFYVRSSSVSDKKASEILMELEDHLLTAQQDGKSFEQVFGQNPKSYCDEIIRELPKPTKREQLGTYALLIPLLLLWRFIGGFSGELVIPLYETIAYMILSSALACGLLVALRKGAFMPKRQSVWITYVISLVTLAAYVGFFVFANRFLPVEPRLVLHGSYAYVTAAISLFIILFSLFGPLLKKKR
ncbi:Protein of unknown function [Paenibacillus algorifonticola]|uniref:DUF1129 family protein n=2 Tax=Paenibacillus algorifonticola TaxID=684063 RepID=A0A1I2F8V2_9BACL|nr:DUF1129 family protein [Paenibacillus algorifonticola]SFF01874.1 Protein of unknown function [Paenibacillus algorifonticola]